MSGPAFIDAVSAEIYPLDERRRIVGVTLACICGDLSVPRSTVMRWLRHEQVPGWAVRTIARHLHMSPERVLERLELSRLLRNGAKCDSATTSTGDPRE